jgi:uridine kinase
VLQPIPPCDDVLARLRALTRRRQTLLVGVDGRGAAGKSTFARALEQAAGDVTVVEFDDFYRPSAERVARLAQADPEIGGSFDWRRLRDQVLAPLSRDEPGDYQRYDWPSDTLAERHSVPVGGVVLVEGTYSTRRDLFAFYDYTVWIDAPRELRLARGVRRGGEDTRERWLTEWMPAEDSYVAAEDPASRVDLALDGSSPG